MVDNLLSQSSRIERLPVAFTSAALRIMFGRDDLATCFSARTPFATMGSVPALTPRGLRLVVVKLHEGHPTSVFLEFIYLKDSSPTALAKLMIRFESVHLREQARRKKEALLG
jgi:hypothetical protein